MYLLYDCLHKSPFSIATQNVLKILDIPFSHITKSFMPHGGYYGRIAKLEHFLFANIYNIALAIQHQGILLALEEDSYANAMFAIHLILHNQNLKDFIHHELQANNISIDLESLSENISYFPAILSNHIATIEKNTKLYFNTTSYSQNMIPNVMPNIGYANGFSTCLYYTNRHFDCNLRGEYAMLDKIFANMRLVKFEKGFSTESFSHLVDINMEKAYQKSGAIMFAGIDLGVDFFCVFGDSVFKIFDKQHNLCVKYCKRDNIAIPILNLAQILLISFDRIQDAGFDLHTIKPNFLLKDGSMVS